MVHANGRASAQRRRPEPLRPGEYDAVVVGELVAQAAPASIEDPAVQPGLGPDLAAGAFECAPGYLGAEDEGTRGIHFLLLYNEIGDTVSKNIRFLSTLVH